MIFSTLLLKFLDYMKKFDPMNLAKKYRIAYMIGIKGNNSYMNSSNIYGHCINGAVLKGNKNGEYYRCINQKYYRDICDLGQGYHVLSLTIQCKFGAKNYLSPRDIIGTHFYWQTHESNCIDGQSLCDPASKNVFYFCTDGVFKSHSCYDYKCQSRKGKTKCI